MSALPARYPGEIVRLRSRALFLRRTPGHPGAEPAVMVHGLGGSSTNWTDLMAAMSDRLAAVAPDLPGFGASPPPDDGDFSPAGHARAVLELMEDEARRAGGPVHLLGNSLGGAVATIAAGLRPDLVRTLTLISPALPMYVPMRTNAYLPVGALPMLGERFVRRLTETPVERRVRFTLQICFGDPTKVPEQRIREAEEELREYNAKPHAPDALLASLRGLLLAYLVHRPYSLWRLASAVQAPTLLIYGRLDKLVDPRTARKAARTFPDARAVMLPASGHVAMMEYPALVSRLIRELLLGTPVRSGSSA